MTQLKPGLKLNSAVCSAQVMVIKPGDGSAITCGGEPMVAASEAIERLQPASDQSDGCLVGKRYVNADQSLEVLCVKAGTGTLASSGTSLEIKSAKKLPSSD